MKPPFPPSVDNGAGQQTPKTPKSTKSAALHAHMKAKFPAKPKMKVPPPAAKDGTPPGLLPVGGIAPAKYPTADDGEC